MGRLMTFAALTLAGALPFAACVPAPGVSAPGAERIAEPSTPKRITVAIQGDPPTLNDDINSAGARGGTPGGAQLEQLVSSGLVVSDDQRVLRPLLAEAVPSVENGLWKVFPDGQMETTLKVRAGAKWHDGAPLTSADVVFSGMVGRDKEMAMRHNLGFDFVEAVEAPDGATVVVKWKRPFIQADELFSSSLLPSHLLERPYAASRETLTQLPYWTQEYVGSGPYRVRDWVGGSHVVLAAFDGYVLGQAKIRDVEVRFIPDPNTMVANILAGAVELTMGRGLSLDQAIQMREHWKEGSFQLSLGSSWIAAFPQLLNPTPSIVADVRFRQALSHAIDRQELTDTLTGGVVPPAYSYLDPTDPLYKDIEGSIVRYEFDPRQAASVVEGLGLRRGADGLLRDTANQRVEVEIRIVGGDQQQKSALAVADYWQRVGVAVQAFPVPPQRLQDAEWRANFPSFELVQQPIGLASNALRRFHGSEASLAENNYRGNNRTRYMNPELDALIDRFFATIPARERTSLGAQILRIMSDQVVPLGVLYVAQPTMVANRIVNVNRGSPWNAHQWDVR